MTRCSYIPPEGESVIAIAKERGGTTDGDIQALIDRFGCKAETTRIIGRAGSTVIDAHACDDHVGHLLGESPCAWVESVGSAPPPGWGEEPDVTIEIVRTDVAPASAFEPPIILSQSPTATAPPVVDLGTNPTREQLEAHGFGTTPSAEYRAARAAFVPMALPSPQTVGVARPAVWTPATPYAVGDQIESDGATWQVARSGAVLSSGNLPLTLHQAIVKPGHDGDSAMLWISTPINASQIAILEDWRCRRVPIRVDAETEPYAYAIGKIAYTGDRPHDGWHLTLVLKQIQLDRMTVQQRARMEQVTGPAATPPPYAVGDQVEWRTGPIDQRWRAGYVTTVVDDRPNDGIDKPFWIVCVDTAGERRFSGPAVAVCLRQPLGVA